MFTQPGQLRRYLIQREGKPFQCIYSPIRGGGELEEHFEHVGRLALEAKDLILYVDEIDMLCSPNALMPVRSSFWTKPENKHRTPVLSELVNFGRHQGVAMVFITRVPAQIHRKITANCDEMRVFRFSEPNVLSYFGSMNGHLPAMLPTLPAYSYALWQQGKDPIQTGGRI